MSSVDGASQIATGELAALLPADRRFFLETSIVSCLTDEVCRAVAAVAPIPLRDLHRRCQVLEPLDRNGTAYRLPEPIRLSLQAELAASDEPAELQQRHLAAAEVMAAELRLTGTISTSPSFDEAINHLFAAGEPRLAADLLAERVGENRATVSVDDLARFQQPELEQYPPHMFTIGIINSDHANFAVAELMLIRMEDAEWSGPLPHGNRDLPTAIAELRAGLPGSSLSKLTGTIRQIREHSTDQTDSHYLGQQYQAAHYSYFLGNFSDAEMFVDEILLGHRSLNRSTLRDQAATVLAASLRAMLARESGDRQAAKQALRSAETLVANYNMPDVVAVVNQLVALTRAIVGEHSTEVRIRMLRRFMNKMVEQSEVIEADLWVQAGLELVCLHDRALDFDLALATLVEVEEFSRGRDLAPLVGDRLGRLRAAVSPPVSATNSSLRITERERAVLYLLTDESLTHVEIADQLGVSINTVKSHLRSIHQKFGATTRSETIEHATQVGLLTTLLPWRSSDL